MKKYDKISDIIGKIPSDFTFATMALLKFLTKRQLTYTKQPRETECFEAFFKIVWQLIYLTLTKIELVHQICMCVSKITCTLDILNSENHMGKIAFGKWRLGTHTSYEALLGGYSCPPSEFQTLVRRDFVMVQCRCRNFIFFMS